MPEEIRLLIVDDEEDFLDVISQRLQSRGFDVTTAGSGQDALEAAAKSDFDTALVDLKMPGMDGEELIKRLKEHDATIEIVVLTGHGSLGSSVTCGRLETYGYMQKVCDINELVHILRRARASRKKKLEIIERRQSGQQVEMTDKEAVDHAVKMLKKITKDS